MGDGGDRGRAESERRAPHLAVVLRGRAPARIPRAQVVVCGVVLRRLGRLAPLIEPDPEAGQAARFARLAAALAPGRAGAARAVRGRRAKRTRGRARRRGRGDCGGAGPLGRGRRQRRAVGRVENCGTRRRPSRAWSSAAAWGRGALEKSLNSARATPSALAAFSERKSSRRERHAARRPARRRRQRREIGGGLLGGLGVVLLGLRGRGRGAAEGGEATSPARARRGRAPREGLVARALRGAELIAALVADGLEGARAPRRGPRQGPPSEGPWRRRLRGERVRARRQPSRRALPAEPRGRGRVAAARRRPACPRPRPPRAGARRPGERGRTARRALLSSSRRLSAFARSRDSRMPSSLSSLSSSEALRFGAARRSTRRRAPSTRGGRRRRPACQTRSSRASTARDSATWGAADAAHR